MTPPTTELVWLITGAGSGLGRQIALAALARGDKVIATARPQSISKTADLKAQGAMTLELEVAAPLSELEEIAKSAIALYGRVDVVVNNAGVLTAGAIEEATPEKTMEVFNSNLFGGLNVARAFLPYMRERKSGTIVWIGSVAGYIALPAISVYSASKWALRGVSLNLHSEIEPFGLRSVYIAPGYIRTPMLPRCQETVPADRKPGRIADYHEMTAARNESLDAYAGNEPGDPAKLAGVLVDLMHGTGAAADKPFPLTLALGSDSYQMSIESTKSDLERLEAWKDVSKSIDF